MIADHKTIMFSHSNVDELTERVLEDYDRYKYFSELVSMQPLRV